MWTNNVLNTLFGQIRVKQRIVKVTEEVQYFSHALKVTEDRVPTARKKRQLEDGIEIPEKEKISDTTDSENGCANDHAERLVGYGQEFILLQ